MLPANESRSSQFDFIASLGDPCLVVDEALVVVAANDAAEALYRPAPSRLTGSPLLEWCPEERRETLTRSLEKSRSRPYSFTVAQCSGDGSLFDAEITASRRDDSRSPGYTLLIRRRRTHPSPKDKLAVMGIALENALDGVVVHTVDGVMLYANKVACQQWGVTDVEELRERGPYGWINEKERPRLAERVQRLVTEGEARFDSSKSRPGSGDLNVEVHARVIDTSDGPIVVSTARDITERIQAEEMVRYLAYHDMLTGLVNRVRLDQELVHEIACSERDGGALGVIFLDLDDFKPVNDTYGHTIGDQVLRTVADRIAGSVRDADVVARLGGDEFVVVLPRLTAAEDLTLIAEKLSEEISQPIAVGEDRVTVTASLGMALHMPGEDANSLMIRADLAMYDARQQGVPGWELFSRSA